MTKPKICVIAATPLTIHIFFRPHLEKMSRWADVTVFYNKNLDTFVDLSDLPVAFEHIPIMRKISLFLDVLALSFLTRSLLRQKYDMVISLVPKAGLLGMFAAKLANIKIRLHIFQGEVWAARSGFSFLILRMADRLTGYFATDLMAVSQSESQFLEKNGISTSEKIKVMGLGSIGGVDLSKFQMNLQIRKKQRKALGIPKNAVTGLFLGRICHDKGVVELIRAYCVVAREYKNYWLIIAGLDEEHLFDQLYNLIDDDLRERVIFTGFCEKPETLITASDFICLLSRREGFGVCMLEAAACGIPALGSKIHGLVDAVIDGQTGILTQLDDQNEVIEAMKKLVNDRHLRLTLGANGRRRVEKYFSHEEVINAYDKEFKKIVMA